MITVLSFARFFIVLMPETLSSLENALTVRDSSQITNNHFKNKKYELQIYASRNIVLSEQISGSYYVTFSGKIRHRLCHSKRLYWCVGSSIAALSVSNSMIDSVAIFFWLVNSVGIRSGFRNKGEKNLLRFFT